MENREIHRYSFVEVSWPAFPGITLTASYEVEGTRFMYLSELIKYLSQADRCITVFDVADFEEDGDTLCVTLSLSDPED